MPIPPVLPDDGFVSFARRSPPVTHVLVYGTLRRGGSNDITLLTRAQRGALFGSASNGPRARHLSMV